MEDELGGGGKGGYNYAGSSAHDLYPKNVSLRYFIQFMTTVHNKIRQFLL